MVGLGRIASALARRLRALGYNVVGTDPQGPRESDTRIVELDELDELLATSDIVSIHAPLEAPTRHLIDARTLALMRPTARTPSMSPGRPPRSPITARPARRRVRPFG